MTANNNMSKDFCTSFHYCRHGSSLWREREGQLFHHICAAPNPRRTYRKHLFFLKKGSKEVIKLCDGANRIIGRRQQNSPSLIFDRSAAVFRRRDAAGRGWKTTNFKTSFENFQKLDLREIKDRLLVRSHHMAASWRRFPGRPPRRGQQTE